MISENQFRKLQRIKAQKQSEEDCKAVGHVKVMTEERNDGDFDCMCLHCGAKWVIPAKEMESE